MGWDGTGRDYLRPVFTRVSLGWVNYLTSINTYTYANKDFFVNFQRDGTNGKMADIGVSSAELVEGSGGNGRKLPQYIAALSGKYLTKTICESLVLMRVKLRCTASHTKTIVFYGDQIKYIQTSNDDS